MPLKMAYLALLMATCSVALPVMNIGNEIMNDMNIETKLRSIEIELMTLAADIKGLKSEPTKVMKEAITTYRNVKSTLSYARYEPKQLAKQTIQTTNDLILYMEEWDKNYYNAEEQKEYIKEQTLILGQLVKESQSVLMQAKTKYDTAYQQMNDTKIKLSTLKRVVSAEFDSDSWHSSIRSKVYGASTGATIGFLIADIFGCLGLCSAIGNTAVWSTSVASVESKIAQVTTKIDELNESIAKLAEDIDAIGTIIEDDSIIIRRWDKCVDHLAYHGIHHIKEASFYRLSLIRKSFTMDLKNLRNATQDFWDRQ